MALIPLLLRVGGIELTFVIDVRIGYESDNGSGKVTPMNSGRIWVNGEQGYTWQQFSVDEGKFNGVGDVLSAICMGLNADCNFIPGGKTNDPILVKANDLLQIRGGSFKQFRLKRQSVEPYWTLQEER